MGIRAAHAVALVVYYMAAVWATQSSGDTGPETYSTQSTWPAHSLTYEVTESKTLPMQHSQA